MTLIILKLSVASNFFNFLNSSIPSCVSTLYFPEASNISNVSLAKLTLLIFLLSDIYNFFNFVNCSIPSCVIPESSEASNIFNVFLRKFISLLVTFNFILLKI